jgi:hypothetical protein
MERNKAADANGLPMSFFRNARSLLNLIYVIYSVIFIWGS